MGDLFERLTSENFVHRVILGKQNALIKISSPWNGSAQITELAIGEMIEQYKDKVMFYSIDPEQDSIIRTAYRIDDMATLLFFKEGTLVDKISGLSQKSIILDKINQLIN